MENNFILIGRVFDHNDHNEKEKRVLCLLTKEDLLYSFRCHLLEGKNTERPPNNYF